MVDNGPLTSASSGSIGTATGIIFIGIWSRRCRALVHWLRHSLTSAVTFLYTTVIWLAIHTVTTPKELCTALYQRLPCKSGKLKMMNKLAYEIVFISRWNGAGQQCCYDINGWLMFSQDWEYNVDYLRFYSAGVANRAHPYGSYPFKRPPYVPSLSNFYNE